MQRLIFSLILGFSLFGLSVFGQSRTAKNSNPRSTVLQNETIEQKIVRVARSYQLDPRLFHSLIYAESTFKVNALSYKGAGCLTQLMPATARRFGLRVDSQVDERFSNVEKCLSAGATYLSFLLTTFRGDVRLALAGYNAGEGAVMKFGWRIPPYRETVQYVEKICALYFGQRGHGVAMAYNQPLAQTWANALYQTWQVKQTTRSFAVPVNPQIAQLPLTETTDQPIQEVTEKAVPKKTVVTRVKVPEPNTRLRTESLSFY